MTFEVTGDYELVRHIMTHPAIYEWIRDDTAPPANEFLPECSPRHVYIVVRDEGEVQGLFVCFLHNLVCWEVHACMLPQCRGKKALEAHRGLCAWLKAHTACRKVIGSIQPDNKPSLRMAILSGAERIGVNTKSVLRHGMLCDQIWVGKEL